MVRNNHICAVVVVNGKLNMARASLMQDLIFKVLFSKSNSINTSCMLCVYVITAICSCKLSRSHFEIVRKSLINMLQSQILCRMHSRGSHMTIILQWRHYEQDGVSNHQPQHWLLNRLHRRRSRKTSKLRVTDLCEGNSPVTVEFPAQRASDAKYDDGIIIYPQMAHSEHFLSKGNVRSIASIHKHHLSVRQHHQKYWKRIVNMWYKMGISIDTVNLQHESIFH